MTTTIANCQNWIDRFGAAGTTASDWLHQVLGMNRKTTRTHREVMGTLRIGGWQHSIYYRGDFGEANTEHAIAALRAEVQELAEELDERLHDLTACENALAEEGAR